MSNNTVSMRLGELASEVWINAAQPDAAHVQLNVGWANVLPGPLRFSPPRPLDLEIAIQHIEEQVMPLAHIIPAGAFFNIGYGDDGGLKPLSFIAEASHLDEIELVFSRLCAIAEGSPAGNDAQLIESTSVAALLIVRELMHHCQLADISIS